MILITGAMVVMMLLAYCYAFVEMFFQAEGNHFVYEFALPLIWTTFLVGSLVYPVMRYFDKEGEPNYRVSWFVRLWHIIRHLAVWMLGFGLMWLALRIGDGQISETMQITLHYFMDGSEAKNVGGEHDLPPNGGYSLRRPVAVNGNNGSAFAKNITVHHVGAQLNRTGHVVKTGGHWASHRAASLNGIRALEPGGGKQQPGSSFFF